MIALPEQSSIDFHSLVILWLLDTARMCACPAGIRVF